MSGFLWKRSCCHYVLFSDYSYILLTPSTVRLALNSEGVMLYSFEKIFVK